LLEGRRTIDDDDVHGQSDRLPTYCKTEIIDTWVFSLSLSRKHTREKDHVSDEFTYQEHSK
jgi:hypothetical protein